MSYGERLTKFVNDEFGGNWLEFRLSRWAAEGKTFEAFYNINDRPVVKMDGRTWIGTGGQTTTDVLRSIDL